MRLEIFDFVKPNLCFANPPPVGTANPLRTPKQLALRSDHKGSCKPSWGVDSQVGGATGVTVLMFGRSPPLGVVFFGSFLLDKQKK